jgi:hypothetical protein
MLSIDQYIEILKNPNHTTIISQPNTPITIKEYKAIYLPGFESSPECIMHSVTYTNIADAKIVAIKFGIAAFDAFNHLLDKFSGYAIEELEFAKSTTSEWHQMTYSPWLFKTLGIGVLYLDAVRFEGNQFWYADSEEILSEMQKIEKKLTKDDLKDKEKK